MKQDHVDTILAQWQVQRPDLDCSPMGVIGRMDRANHLMKLSLEEVFKQFGLMSSEFDILATLRRAGEPVTPTEMYQTLMFSSGAMSTRVDGLVKRGLVVRQASETDRRSCLVMLTDEGRTLIDAVVTAHVENEHQMLNVLTEKEQATLASLLRKWLASKE
ncbi:MarR family transcriptional regulator [Enterovibrio norvegicus]|uniref:DNA-binding transcriptional regulator, MarR family n=2 Tax=Enterovibrio norvegicus TaxID=188144 RepID=A0A1I5KC85_9GAMM|nr:MarR family transcriptional regulator [Enterovibrio norvegicus]MCC4798162.1 MarR family transcriptional regulator [Enterovibrio norvegicus]OEE49083.1 MarR family transcriptional regulator [Enterovibrio norvegicus]OEF55936.1 MarR family transcriptional regulator [Enterovibrio norvegicus]PMH72160.1 MarR family transcriptional regulator [Enterovibrio norvegicus]PMI32435.1 MarR family transcriptional regulator [Enterovibrio norvegicus]